MAAGFVSHHSGPHRTTRDASGPDWLRPRWTAILSSLCANPLLVVGKLQFDRKRRTVVGDLRHDFVTGF